MATITLTFSHPSQSASKSVTLPDGQMARLFGGFKKFYIRTEGAPAEITNAEIFDKLFAEFISSVKNRVLSEERAEAEKTATVGLPSIDIE